MRAVVLLWAGLTLTTVGCGANGDEKLETGGSIAESLGTETATSGVAYAPVSSFYSTFGPPPSLIQALHVEWQQQVLTCMTGAGFPDYQVLPKPEGPFRPVRHDELARDELEVMGFLPISNVDQLYARAADDQDARLESDGAFRAALVGDESSTSTGCAGSARSDVYGVDNVLTSTAALLSNLDSEVLVRVLSSSDYTSLELDWSKCMEDKGETFSTRSSMFNRIWEAPRPSSDEIRVSLADFDCRAVVNFGERYASISEPIYRLIAEDNAEQLADATSQLDELAQTVEVP